MRFRLIGSALLVLVCAASGCSDDDPLTPPEIDPSGQYTVSTTIVSNSCVEAFSCEPICRMIWFGIDEFEQPLYIGRYGSDLVVCPLGPLDASELVHGSYADGTFEYALSSGIIISSPDPGCRMERRWSANVIFDSQGFAGEAFYDLAVVDGDPDLCAASSAHYTSLPCRTHYRFEGRRCVGCTPAVCDPG